MSNKRVMIKGLILTEVLLFLVLFGKAQNGNGNRKDYIGDARIDTLIHLHQIQNQKFPFINGYRIQIYKETGNTALDSAWSVKNRFEGRYPEVQAYISFREPYYRVRVGDFKTRLEALRFLGKIHRKYPNSWEIKDKIRFQKIIKKNPYNTPSP